MKGKSITIGLLSLGLAGAWIPAIAKEVSIHQEALPAAVKAAMDSRYPGAEILGLSQEKQKGIVIYEAEMKVSGKKVDALFDSNGKFREEEALISASDLPESVSAALAKSAQAKWKIDAVERLTTSNASAPPKYEIQVSNGKRHAELVYTADGKRVKAAKAEAKEAKDEEKEGKEGSGKDKD